MHKLAHPISIFSLVVLGLILVLFKAKFSFLLDIQSSYVFAFGIFCISLGLGLILYNYLVSDFVVVENSTIENKQTVESKKELKSPEKQVVVQNVKPEVAPVILESKEPNLEPIKAEVVEIQKNNNDISKIDQSLEHLAIDKENVLKLLNRLNSELYSEQKKQKKNIFNSRLVSFFAALAILASIVIFVLFFALHNLVIFAAVGLFVFFSFFFIFKAQTTKKRSLHSIDILAQRIQNLTLTTKRFRAISQANDAALKNTINSLTDENKREIVTKIIK